MKNLKKMIYKKVHLLLGKKIIKNHRNFKNCVINIVDYC